MNETKQVTLPEWFKREFGLGPDENAASWACCPFCGNKTAFVAVRPSDGTGQWRCQNSTCPSGNRGVGASGNIWAYVAAKGNAHNLDSAIRWLAEVAGIERPTPEMEEEARGVWLEGRLGKRELDNEQRRHDAERYDAERREAYSNSPAGKAAALAARLDDLESRVAALEAAQ